MVHAARTPSDKQERQHYPIDVELEAMCAQAGILFTACRFLSMPAELILRKEHGWVYLGRMFFVQCALCLGLLWFKALPYLTAGHLPSSLLAWGRIRVSHSRRMGAISHHHARQVGC